MNLNESLNSMFLYLKDMNFSIFLAVWKFPGVLYLDPQMNYVHPLWTYFDPGWTYLGHSKFDHIWDIG